MGAPDRSTVASNVRKVRENVARACARAGRDPSRVRIVAAGKSVPIEKLGEARLAGIRDFGENYARELADKAARMDGVEWHYIGTLQRGSAGRVADIAAVIHSAVLGPALARVARRAVAGGRRIDCLAQVDYTGGRHGMLPDEVSAFMRKAFDMEGIRPVGLMTLPPPIEDPEGARPYFAKLRQLRDSLAGAWPEVVELSMGMSADYEVAVEEGATMLRVGTALFGERPAKNAPGGTRSAPG